VARIRVDVGPEGFFGFAEETKRTIFVFLWAPVRSQPGWEFAEDDLLQAVPMSGREWIVGRY
jgi:hypothetical protein